jgi:predicted nucleotidyltransferase
MKNIVGIVAEFNPLHDGHKLLLKKTKKSFPDATIVIAMSGNTVQRGEFAVEDKFKRANDALVAGADIVVELPTLTTLNNANRFAEGAIKLFRDFGVNAISFGSESNDPEKIVNAAVVMSDIDFDNKMKNLVKETQSYPIAFATLIGFNFESNDILAASYLAEMMKLEYDMNISSLKREKHMPKASDIRKEMRANNVEGITNMDDF